VKVRKEEGSGVKVKMTIVSILLILPQISQAMIETETLPAGVRSPSVRFGMISQLDQQYTDSGSLSRSVDQRSIEFNAQRLVQIQPRVQQVVSLFDDIQKGLGSALNLGTLRVDSRPEVQYTGFVMGVGINDRWTLGGGVPVIHYKNNIQVSKTPSNISAYKAMAAGLGPDAPTLINGLDELEKIDLVKEFYSELQHKGYTTLQNQDQTYLGDFIVSSRYRMEKIGPVEGQFRLDLSLPTGPKYDPDNLAALNQFGYTYLEPQIVAAVPLNYGLTVASMLGVRFYVPDQISARVPKDDNDILPDADTKENVRRIGGIRTAETLQLSYRMNGSWNFYGLSEWAQKAADRFEGTENKRYDLLSRGTDTQTHIVTGGISFSSVEAYQKRQNGIPAIVSAQVSDTIAGKNVQRQLVQEISAVLFF
jgi:hypothetical protein